MKKKLIILESIIAIIAILYGLLFISVILGAFLFIDGINIFINRKKGKSSRKQVGTVLGINLFMMLFMFFMFSVVLSVDYFALIFFGLFNSLPIILSVVYLNLEKKIDRENKNIEVNYDREGN